VIGVSFGFRKRVRLGPLRLTASKCCVTASTSLGRGSAEQEQPRLAHHDRAGAG